MMSVPRPAMFVAIVTRAAAAGLRDDLRLALVVLGVEHLVLDAALLEQVRQALALLDRHRADQDRPPLRSIVVDLACAESSPSACAPAA